MQTIITPLKASRPDSLPVADQVILFIEDVLAGVDVANTAANRLDGETCFDVQIELETARKALQRAMRLLEQVGVENIPALPAGVTVLA